MPRSTQNPLHLYPESPQKLHPNVQLNAPAPRINSRIFLLVKAKGNNKDRFAHHLKVANRSIFVAQTSPARCVSEREKGGGPALRESRTVGSGTPLVTFVVKRKSPGCRAERLHWRSRDFRPCKISPGCGAQRPQIVGTQGSPPLHHPPPLSKDSPLIQKRTIFIHKFMLYCFCQKSYFPNFR